jgi:hypothetical protein
MRVRIFSRGTAEKKQPTATRHWYLHEFWSIHDNTVFLPEIGFLKKLGVLQNCPETAHFQAGVRLVGRDSALRCPRR